MTKNQITTRIIVIITTIIMMGLSWNCPVFVAVIVTMGLLAFAWLVLFDGGGSTLVCLEQCIRCKCKYIFPYPGCCTIYYTLYGCIPFIMLIVGLVSFMYGLAIGVEYFVMITNILMRGLVSKVRLVSSPFVFSRSWTCVVLLLLCCIHANEVIFMS